MKKIIKSLIILGIISSVLFPQKAHAYLDPGTGSYVLQIAAAVLFGGLFAIKAFWGKITGFFTNIFSRKENSSEKHSKKDN